MMEAIVGFVGVVVGAVVSYFAQLRATRFAVDAELKRLEIEDRLRRREKNLDRIHDWVSQILVECDPELNKTPDHGKVVANIHRLQLLLDTEKNNGHRKLNGALNALAVGLREGMITEKERYGLQSKITEAVKAINE